MSGSATKLYGQKAIRACDIRCRTNMRMYTQIAGTCRKCGLSGGTLAYAVVNYFGATCRIAHKQIESAPTSIPFLLPNSITACSVQFSRTFSTGSHNMREEGKGKRKARIDNTNLKRPNATLREVPERNSKPRIHRQATAYSKMTVEEAQIRLGVRLSLPGISIADMLEGKCVLLEPSMVQEVKRETYQGLIRFLNIEGYPNGSRPGFKEANINDVVAFTLSPLLDYFKRKSMRNLLLLREKEIIPRDKRKRGMEEFVMRDYISLTDERYIMVVESKREALLEARKHCFLALRDMRDNTGGGTIYGFVTTGVYWNMVTFDGQFQISQTIPLLFETMAKDEQRWLQHYSILVDCFHVALTNAAQDPVGIVGGNC